MPKVQKPAQSWPRKTMMSMRNMTTITLRIISTMARAMMMTSQEAVVMIWVAVSSIQAIFAIF